MASSQPESSVDAVQVKEYTTKKFQSLNVSDTFKVNGFKPLTTKYGRTYILLANHIPTNTDIEVFAPKMIVDHINSGIIKGGFTFQVKYDEYTKFKYAVILF